MCGGTCAAPRPARVNWGLSPRVRGNRRRPGGLPALRRSIPACAGEPRAGLKSWPAGRVYPRVCGGTVMAVPPATSGWGLSPRVRGNPDHWG